MKCCMADYCRPEVLALGGHAPQKMAYEWFLRVAGDVRGKRVFDFGPGGYPFGAMLARLGAQVSWYDRDTAAEAQMAELAERWGVALRRRKSLNGGTVDIIVASNAVQHNEHGAETIYHTFRKLLAPGGRVLLAEKLAQGATRWNAERDDPCWERTLRDHMALWRAAGLCVEHIGAFRYEWDREPSRETAWWCGTDAGNEVVASLRRAEASP